MADADADDDHDTIDLLHRWYSGDRDALQRLIADNLAWMQGFVRRRLQPQLRRRLDSGDLLQEGAMQLLRHAPRYAPQTRAQFRAFVAEVLLNVLRAQYSACHADKRAVHREQPLPSEGASRGEIAGADTQPDAAAARAEVRSWVQLGMELLQSDEREVLRLRQTEQLQFDDIARRLHLPSADAARMRFHRALARLTVAVRRLRASVRFPE